MMIANPFAGKSLFSTHPPMDKRIDRLVAMAKADPRYLRH
jgi:Zn-dependent protease with chaperone function